MIIARLSTHVYHLQAGKTFRGGCEMMTVLAFLASVGTGATGVQDAASPGAIEITVVNTWQAPYAQEILDLSYTAWGWNLAFRSSSDGKIFFADPDDGSYQGEVPLPEDCTGFGLEIYDGSEYFVTNTATGQIQHGLGVTWESFDNPALPGEGALAWSCYGMGPAMAEGVSTSDEFYVFDLYGGGLTTYVLPGIGGTMSGVAAHEVAVTGQDYSPFALVVTCSDYPWFYFYLLYGGQYYMVGEEPCPVPVQQSLGIELLPDRGTFFWSYIGTDGEYYVSELEIPVLGALDEATWGSIKAFGEY